MTIQLDVAKDHVPELELLMFKTKCSGYTEFFNQAMTLLRWAVDQKAEGRSIFSVDESENSWIELQLPVLEYVVPQIAKEYAEHKALSKSMS